MAVKSAERVFRIFELLEQSPEGLTNKEVSSLLGFAPSSTLALLQTMEENGYLSADEQKRYYLGGRLMSIGAVAASRIDLNQDRYAISQETYADSGRNLFPWSSFRR